MAKSNGSSKGKFTYEKDSRKGTYHRYQVSVIADNGVEIFGTLYIPKGKAGDIKKLTLKKGR